MKTKCIVETAAISTETKSKGKSKARRRKLSDSEILRRKSRMIGSDDLNTAINVCRWAEQGGLRGNNLEVAEGLAKAFEETLVLSQTSQHYEAAKKAKSVEYVLKRNDRVAGLMIDCRDGRKRKLSQVVSWFADRHFRIANDIAEAEEVEARLAAAAEAKAAAKVVAEENAETTEVKVA